MSNLRQAAQQAILLCQWIDETPHVRGSINGMAAQVQHALRAALAEPEQEPVAWVPVAEALPKSGVKVLACYRNRLGNLRRIRAQWIAGKTQEADGEDSEACSEYDEATDTYFTSEGWYECIDNWSDYSSVAVTEGDVTHWMPLPPNPDTAPTPQPEQEPVEPADEWLQKRYGTLRGHPEWRELRAAFMAGYQAALAEPEQPVALVAQLWAIIDDIDTYGDMAKADDKLYRSLVERRQADRWKTGITTDGYTLNMPSCSAPTPRRESTNES